MTATSAFAALAPGLLVLLLSAAAQEQQEKPAENPDKRLALSKRNAAAEELESLVLALGLDAHRKDPSAQHPSPEDLEAYQHAAFGSWLDAQLRTADNSIAAVPASFQSFLEKRQRTLWRVVGLLERDVPQWDSDPRAEPRDLSGVTLGIALARILTAAALVEERACRHAPAGDLLEATWSLSRSFSGQPDQAFDRGGRRPQPQVSLEHRCAEHHELHSAGGPPARGPRADREGPGPSTGEGRFPRRAMAGEVLRPRLQSLPGLLLRVPGPRRSNGDPLQGSDRRWWRYLGAAPLLRGPGSPPDADTRQKAPLDSHSPAPRLTPGFLPA